MLKATSGTAEVYSVQHVARNFQRVDSMLINVYLYEKLLSICRSSFTLATCCRGRATSFKHVEIVETCSTLATC
jgi:hypothetical protein